MSGWGRCLEICVVQGLVCQIFFSDGGCHEFNFGIDHIILSFFSLHVSVLSLKRPLSLSFQWSNVLR